MICDNCIIHASKLNQISTILYTVRDTGIIIIGVCAAYSANQECMYALKYGERIQVATSMMYYYYHDFDWGLLDYTSATYVTHSGFLAIHICILMFNKSFIIKLIPVR